jgi:hypothetical protein
MPAKITLITPPDIYENNNKSILFVHLNDGDQDLISKYLAQSKFDKDVNFYVYNGEPNITWLLWAIGCCQYKFIDLDGSNEITQALSGYILGKNNFYYKTSNENLASIYSYISNRRVLKIENVLEDFLND